ncbi:MAG: LuxR C-terminal-related transcriptional regulator [Oscillospiraceae bacterium]
MDKVKPVDTTTVYLTAAFKEKMQLITQYPCTLVEAPMGYGKTTGVREYLKNKNVRVLWQKLHDDSISEFWMDFCRLFCELDVDCYQSLLQIGFPTNSNVRETVLELLKNVLSSEASVLVLDDYHLADSPEINDFIEYLLWNELPELHLVLTARYTRLENLDELVLKGYLQHIQKDALEFTPKEIETYYRLCGVILKENEVQGLHVYTEGWISALYLLMLNYKKEGILVAPPNIHRLIEKTVFLPFQPETRDFIVHICFLDTFTLEQAAYIWQQENTEALLTDIIERNAFITLDERSGTFQVHKIFSEFIQKLVKQMDEAERDRLYRRIASWYTKTEEYPLAFRYYYLAKDFDALLIALKEDQGHSLLNEHRAELLKYYDECPPAVLEQHPVSLLVIAICLFSYNETERFAAVCTEIGMLLHKNEDGENQTLREIEGELELLLSFTEYNDLERMGEHIKTACNLMEHPSQFMDTRGGWTFGSPSVVYMFHRTSGQLARELEWMKEALPYYDRVARGHGAGADSIMEAEFSYLRGEFDNAEILAHQAIYHANLCKQQDIVICAAFLQMKLALYRGDHFGAAEILQTVKMQTKQRKWYFLLDTIELCEVFLMVFQGQKQEIPQWIENGDFTSSKLYFPTLAFFNVVYGHVLLIREEYHRLLGNMDYFMENASVFPNLMAQIYIHIYASAANKNLHRRDMAAAELKKAMDLARPDLIRMPFVEYGQWIASVLSELYQDGCQSEREFISSIFRLYEPYKAGIDRMAADAPEAAKSMLTEREAEVARLVAQGLSNKEIGLRLYISTNTVKTMLKRMFEKLGISSRAMLQQYMD